ncbi:TonB-dependent receptor plug domain-containing protein [Pseudomonas qingdaonensis]|jgi:iron complex outermembrane receptor protein|uniref:TonB-dependent receptor plug domain-containing protein n=1 Tax=Pseudomonas qingdaonensis TaxID=2056231 RepID=UPI001E3205B3|nr:TonB-dependent receptor plug domain-containing protein [Pseudomonas qingdaonensis]
MKPLTPHALLVAVAALGAESALAEQKNTFTLGEIQISAPQDETLSTGGSVIDLKDIRLHDRETVASALTLAPGVNLGYIGGRAEQVVFVRGFDRLQVPVYIDGIPTYVPYDGNIDLGRFTTYDLSRIQVDKGFASLLYGPNTMGGAINLVTRRPVQEFEGEVGGGLELTDHGNVNAYRTYANVGSNQGAWWMQGGVSYVDYDYTLLPDDFKPTNNQQGTARPRTATTATPSSASSWASPPTKPMNTCSATFSRRAARASPPMPASCRRPASAHAGGSGRARTTPVCSSPPKPALASTF